MESNKHWLNVAAWLALTLGVMMPARAQEGTAANLLVEEQGVRILGHSSSYGGWDVSNMVPSLARLQEPGVTVEDFIWCTADGAPFPHWVLFELKQAQWLTTLVFNNALKEEPAYPGISARDIEVWVGEESAERLRKVAAFRLERNKSGQSVQIEPVQARWLKFVITSNWGHPTWTEMNASAVYDDGSRPAQFAAELKAGGKVDVYGIYFDFNSATLRAESRRALEEIVAFHRAYPTQSLVIEGHTDDVGSAQSNLALSQRRAQAVVAELVRMGASAGSIEASGHGAAQPVASNASAAGRAKNRRVTVRLAGE